MSGVELPCGMGRAIADIVQQSGEEDVETGGFALAPMDASTGTVLALTGTKGIERNWGLFRNLLPVPWVVSPAREGWAEPAE